MQSLRGILQHELHQRRERNGNYSLRAFARDLDVSPSRLSELLKREASPRPATIRRILSHLSMKPDAIESIVEAVQTNSPNGPRHLDSSVQNFIVPRATWMECKEMLFRACEASPAEQDYLCVTLSACTPLGLAAVVREQLEHK